MLDEEINDDVNHLLELKINSNETEYIPVIKDLNQYIEKNINEILTVNKNGLNKNVV